MGNIFGPVLNQLSQDTRKISPSIFDAFNLLIKEVDRIANLVDPAPVTQSKVNTTIYPPPLAVVTFLAELSTTNILLSWEAPSSGLLFYEVREGTDWDIADRLFVTSNLSAILDPSTIGLHTYLIKTISTNGIYSLTATSTAVTINSIGSFTLVPEVINNFVSIDWETPTSDFLISYYKVYENGSLIISRNTGTFFSLQKNIGGDYTYAVVAVDIAGNESAQVQTTVSVADPTDFDFEASLTSSFSGTIVNGKVGEDGKLYVNIDTATTYENHFINNGWTSPQDQVDAGFTRWIQPTTLTGSYEEVFDFGVIFANVVVNLSWLFEEIVGSHNFGLSIKVSDDNITYSTAYTSAAFFVTSVRYVKAKFTFTGNNTKALLAFYQFVVTLNVRREIDGDTAQCFAADAAGTVVLFNKAFKIVESITVTADSTVERTTVYDFAGGVDPTQFLVKVFNSAGARVDSDISWKARGVF